MNYFRNHEVRLKKARRGWDNKQFYPVITMDIKAVGPAQEKVADQYKVISPDEPFVVNHLDEDDEEYLDEVSEKKITTPTAEKVITWLLIANANNGKYMWVTTEDVKYGSVTS
jgi:hypothetical protein